MICMPITTKHTRSAQSIQLIRDYWETGGRRVLECILTLHTGILNPFVRRYAGSSGGSHEDLLQVGYVGLSKVVNGYELDSAAKFSSYAYTRINGALRHHFRDTVLGKKPRWARSLASTVLRVGHALTSELGRSPLMEEIAENLSIPRRTWRS